MALPVPDSTPSLVNLSLNRAERLKCIMLGRFRDSGCISPLDTVNRLVRHGYASSAGEGEALLAALVKRGGIACCTVSYLSIRREEKGYHFHYRFKEPTK